MCNQPAGSHSKPYTADQMRAAVQAGYRPPKSIMDTMAEMYRNFGLSLDVFVDKWLNQVMDDTTGWLLCPSCQPDMEKALKKATAPLFCVFCKHPIFPNAVVMLPEVMLTEMVALGAMRHPGPPSGTYKTGEPCWIACLTCWNPVAERAKQLMGI
jgi:hypothetical protein